MKKNYTLYLDEEKFDKLREWLNLKGLSISGYFNSMIDEQIIAIDVFSELTEKKKVKTSDLLKVAGRMVKELSKELKDGKKTSKA